MNHFLIKQKPEDFIVDEILPFEPEGKGDFFYIYFQKKLLATNDVLERLRKKFGLNRNEMGIAGLKDKIGITRQWLSISRRSVEKCGGEKFLVGELSTIVKILKLDHHTKPLRLGGNAGSRFELGLDLQTKMPHKKLEEILRKFAEPEILNFIPNYFGEQRFGRDGKNWISGKKLLLGEIKSIRGDHNTPTEKRFKIQAFMSHLFNKYLTARVQKGILRDPVPGDVIENQKTGATRFFKKGESLSADEIITGPVYGHDLKRATDQALQLEQSILTKEGVNPKDIERCKNFDIFGIRRKLFIDIKDFGFSVRGKMLRVRFTLGSGSYATVVTSYLDYCIERMLKTQE